jgi:hypothetical protein
VPTDWAEIREAARTAFDEVERAALTNPLHDVDEPPPDLPPTAAGGARASCGRSCIYMVTRNKKGNER